MKPLKHKKTAWMCLASALILVLFFLMAGGSIMRDLLSQFYFPEISRKKLDDGRIQETHEYSDSYICEERVWHYKVTGHYDAHMRWHGLLRIEKIVDDHGMEILVYTEEVMMVHGKRDGLSTTVHRDGSTTYKVYNMGYELEDQAGGKKGAEAVTAFSLLDGHYSWQQEMFHEAGYDDLFLQAFLDTFELLLDSYEFGIEAFDSIYGEVEDRLDDTRFDTLLRMNTNFYSFVNGMELLKEAEFRMAVIDQHREGNRSLFEVIQTTYPGYLSSMEPEGVHVGDFESFSQVFDSCMNSYGPFDTADPVNFIDSLDTRIYRALTGIYNSGQKKSAFTGFQNPAIVPKFIPSRHKRSTHTSASPPEVAELILVDLLSLYVEGNVFRQCIRKSWSINQGLVLLPTLTTSTGVPLSSGRVEITGFVLEDGGSPVSSRGIVWAGHYDPTLQDRMESSGTGTGTFAVELEGLEEGKTYYARSYATNVSGTSYGNCVSFTADASSNLEPTPLLPGGLELFPNPASDVLWLRIQRPFSGNARLILIQAGGQEVYRQELSEPYHPVDGIRIDLSSLDGGLYICQIRDQGQLIAIEKFILIRN